MYETHIFSILVNILESGIQGKNYNGHIIRYPFQKEKNVLGTVHYAICTAFQVLFQLPRITVGGESFTVTMITIPLFTSL